MDHLYPPLTRGLEREMRFILVRLVDWSTGLSIRPTSPTRGRLTYQDKGPLSTTVRGLCQIAFSIPLPCGRNADPSVIVLRTIVFIMQRIFITMISLKGTSDSDRTAPFCLPVIATNVDSSRLIRPAILFSSC